MKALITTGLILWTLFVQSQNVVINYYGVNDLGYPTDYPEEVMEVATNPGGWDDFMSISAYETHMVAMKDSLDSLQALPILWIDLHLDYFSDWMQARDSMVQAILDKGIANLIGLEKELGIKYLAFHTAQGYIHETAAINYLTSTGLTNAQAWEVYLGYKQNYWNKRFNSYLKRWKAINPVLTKYLDYPDMDSVYYHTMILKDRYINSGIVGQDYGNSIDGIIDWINSTNGFVGNGLEEEGYTLKTGTYTEFKNDLNAVLIDGDY